MQVRVEAVLADLVLIEMSCSADQFGSRRTFLTPQLVELLDLLSGELDLPLYFRACTLPDAVSDSWITDFRSYSLLRSNATVSFFSDPPTAPTEGEIESSS